jgi:hypothetical protein
MNKYTDYAWLKYISSTNNLSEFIWKNIFKILMIKNYINLFLFTCTIIFSLYDTISSIYCLKLLGYEHESNLLFRWAMQNYNIAGFIIVKMGITMIILLIIYYIIEKNTGFYKKIFYTFYFGIIISNIYVGISNISILLGNDSFYLFNLNIIQSASISIFFSLFIIFSLIYIKKDLY